MFNNFKKIINLSLSSRKNRGLTLVELMVVISIFLVITSVTVFEYGSFRTNVSLQNLTDDIALSIRKAQGFAIGSRAIGADFTKSYGIHFSLASSGSVFDGTNKAFLMFSVPISSPEKKYTSTGDCGSETSSCVELFQINSADIIKNIIAYDGTTVVSSSSSDSSIDIVFTRPDPRAYFCYRETSSSSCDTNISSVNITVSNGQTDEKEKSKIISIQNTGQISIQ